MNHSDYIGSPSKERIAFALDVATKAEALGWVQTLKPRVGIFKIGLELFVSEGPALVEEILQQDVKVFLDLKLHDIPQTMANAVTRIATLGVHFTTLHASAGSEAMTACKAAADANPHLHLLAVTALTSMDDATQKELMFPEIPLWSRQLTQLAKHAAIDGIVCSAHEVEALRAAAPDMIICVPGIRPTHASAGDQKRIATPQAAINSGASFLVVGRPIRDAADPILAAENILKEIQ